MATLLTPMQFEINAQSNTDRFIDVKQDSWYYNPVTAIVDRGYAYGTSDITFSPEKNLTREEAVTMIIKVLLHDATILKKYTPTGEMFDDVPFGKWYTPYVELACVLGITAGVGEGKFGVGELVTREDFAVMVFKSLDPNLRIYYTDNLESKFIDYNQIDSYALEALKKLTGINQVSIGEASSVIQMKSVFAGYNNYLRPLNAITRAEAATVIYTAYIVDGLSGVTISA